MSVLWDLVALRPSKQCTVKALIKALRKELELLLTYRGAMFSKVLLNQSATVRPRDLQRPGYKWLRRKYRMWSGLEVHLAIDYCYIVSKVEIIQ